MVVVIVPTDTALLIDCEGDVGENDTKLDVEDTLTEPLRLDDEDADEEVVADEVATVGEDCVGWLDTRELGEDAPEEALPDADRTELELD